MISLKVEALCCEPNEYFIKICDGIAFDSRELILLICNFHGQRINITLRIHLHVVLTYK